METSHQAIKPLAREDRRLFERHFVGKFFEFLNRGHGKCILRTPEIGGLLAEALLYFNSQRLDTGDFVVMPNHVHVLMTPYAGFELEDVLHSIKSYTSNQINRKRNRFGMLWMEETYDEELLRIQAYIRANPARAKAKDIDCRLREAEYDVNEY